MKKCKIAKHIIKDIIAFCEYHKLKYNLRRRTIEKREFYIENGRILYVDTDKNVIKEYYDKYGVSTSYRQEGGVNHLPTDRRR